jgi:hypothetical protein
MGFPRVRSEIYSSDSELGKSEWSAKDAKDANKSK